MTRPLYRYGRTATGRRGHVYVVPSPGSNTALCGAYCDRGIDPDLPVMPEYAVELAWEPEYDDDGVVLNPPVILCGRCHHLDQDLGPVST